MTGKTSLIMTFVGLEKEGEMSSTIGFDFYIKDIKYDGITYKIKIIDTAGQEQYHSMALHMLKKSKGILLVYSIDDNKTFENLESKWIEEIKETIDIENIPLFLIGNKKDLEDEREVDEKIAREFANKNNFKFYETSAKTKENVDLTFQEMINTILNNYLKEKEEKNKNNTKTDNETEIKIYELKNINNKEKTKKKIKC